MPHISFKIKAESISTFGANGLTTPKKLSAPRIETRTRPIFLSVHFSANSMMLIDFIFTVFLPLTNIKRAKASRALPQTMLSKLTALPGHLVYANVIIPLLSNGDVHL